jgi:hypothetical protein
LGSVTEDRGVSHGKMLATCAGEHDL